MSDFDKEAEREKLREKYERDEKKREATEQMSELLLQGATMTNAHCSECNDPIFRYDGQEFCPTCEKAVDRGTGDGEDNGAAADGADGADGNEGGIQVTSPDDNTRVAFGANAGEGESASRDSPDREAVDPQEDRAERPGTPDDSTPTAPTRSPRTADASPGEDRRTRPGSQQDLSGGQQEPSDHQRESRRTETRTVPGIEPERSADTTGSRADTTAARESLIRTLTRFSQQAEATDDPQRAREYLAAAREAAETLSKLR